MTERDVPVTKKQLKSLFYIVCLIAALAFVGYHMINMLGSDIVTVRASERITHKSIELTAFLARDEEIVADGGDGVVLSDFTNGAKIRKGETCVGVYPASKAGAADEIRLLNYKLALLTEAMRFSTAADTENGITLSYIELMRKLAGGDVGVENEIYSLTLALSGREYFFDKNSLRNAYDSTAAEIQSVAASLGSPIDSAEMPFSGYLFTDGDRFGKLFGADLAESGTADEILAAIATYNNSDNGEKNVVVAARTSEWYLLCPADKEEIKSLAKGSVYTVFAGGIELEATLLDIRTSAESGDEVLVLSLTSLPEGFTYDRRMDIELSVGEERTYRIPTSAVRTADDGSTGVYIMSGGVVLFRRVEIVKSTENYVLVKSYRSYTESLGQEKDAEDIYSSSAAPALSVGIYRGDPDSILNEDSILDDGTVLVKSPVGDVRINTFAGSVNSQYQYLEENELIIISGNKLYHGKIPG